MTSVSPQSSSIDLEAEGYPQSFQLKTLGHADFSKLHMVARSELLASVAELVSGTELSFFELHYIHQHLDRFRSKASIAFEAQSLPQSILHNDYTQ